MVSTNWLNLHIISQLRFRPAHMADVDSLEREAIFEFAWRVEAGVQ